MLTGSDKQVRVRLGRFGFDLQTGELWPLDGDGERVVLPRQPFQILRMLIGSHQKLVTREDIRQTLWPNDTTVDFDHSINVAIRLLRRAFGDSAESPRFIETLARRGYRLIVPPEPIYAPQVEQAPVDAPTAVTPAEPGTPADPNGQGPQRGSTTPTDAPRRESGRIRAKRFWMFFGCSVLALAIAFWTNHVLRNASFALGPSDTVVLAVTNTTADPVFNDAIYISVLRAVEQTPYLNVLAVNRVAEEVQKFGVAIDPTRISPPLAARVCLETSSRLVLHTSILSAGNGFRITQDATDCKTNKVVAHTAAEAPNRQEVVTAVGAATVRLRSILGEPKESISKFNAPLALAASSSPDALQMLTEGYRHSLLADFGGAARYYQRAIQIDSNLAMAYVALAGAEDSEGHEGEAAQASTAGYRLRDRLTAPMRLNAEEIYFQFGTGELEKRCSVLTQFLHIFPNDSIAHVNLSGCLELLGHFDASLAEAREGLRLLDSSVSYDRVLRSAMLSGRDMEARTAYEDAVAHHFDGALLHRDRLQLAFLQHDAAAMDQQWAWASAHAHADDGFLFDKSLIASYFGHLQESRRLSDHASDVALQTGDLESVAFYRAQSALQLAEAGQAEDALRAAAGTVQQVPNTFTTLVLAMAFARAGEIERARNLAGQVRRERPKDTLIQNFCLPSIDAAIALGEKRPQDALDSLHASLGFDLADVPAFGNLFPSYLRGLAYQEAGQPQLALVEFGKVLDHPALAGFSILLPLSHLQIARAYAAIPGENALARDAYKEFLNTWSSADQNLAVYRTAKAEVLKLEGQSK